MSYLSQFNINIERPEYEDAEVLPIGHPDNPWPIPKHPAQEILDSTKLRQFENCPRGFFFMYELGWRPRTKNINLVFGSAWHELLDVIYGNDSIASGGEGIPNINNTPEVVAEAIDAHMKTFESEGGALIQVHTSKNNRRALEILRGYVERSKKYGDIPHPGYLDYYKEDNDRYRVIYTELVAAVPITPTRTIYGKMDMVAHDRKTDRIIAMEHKTTGSLSSKYQAQWEYDVQPGTYQFVGQALYGDQFGGVLLNATVFKVRSHDFFRHLYLRNPEQMALWHAEVNHSFDMIDWSRKTMINVGDKPNALPCYPRRCSSATRYGCSFPTLCSSWANPLRYDLSQPPSGYMRKFWNPQDKERNFKLVGDSIDKLEVVKV